MPRNLTDEEQAGVRAIIAMNRTSPKKYSPMMALMKWREMDAQEKANLLQNKPLTVA